MLSEADFWQSYDRYVQLPFVELYSVLRPSIFSSSRRALSFDASKQFWNQTRAQRNYSVKNKGRHLKNDNVTSTTVFCGHQGLVRPASREVRGAIATRPLPKEEEGEEEEEDVYYYYYYYT